MITTELIKALREKPSRDNRALLDEAADQLELAHKALIALTEVRMRQEAEIERQKEALYAYALQYGTAVDKEFTEGSDNDGGS